MCCFDQQRFKSNKYFCFLFTSLNEEKKKRFILHVGLPLWNSNDDRKIDSVVERLTWALPYNIYRLFFVWNNDALLDAAINRFEIYMLSANQKYIFFDSETQQIYICLLPISVGFFLYVCIWQCLEKNKTKNRILNQLIHYVYDFLF